MSERVAEMVMFCFVLAVFAGFFKMFEGQPTWWHLMAYMGN